MDAGIENVNNTFSLLADALAAPTRPIRTFLNGEPWLATVILPGATAGQISDWLEEAPGTGLTVEHTGTDSVVDVIGGLVNFAPGVTS